MHRIRNAPVTQACLLTSATSSCGLGGRSRGNCVAASAIASKKLEPPTWSWASALHEERCFFLYKKRSNKKRQPEESMKSIGDG